MAFSIPRERIEAARGGDAASIDWLIEAIWPDTVRLAAAIVGHSGAAEDAAQEACIVLYRSIGNLRSASAFRFWFYRVVVREAWAVKRGRGRPDPSTDANAAMPCVDTAQALDVWRALATLPDDLRETVVLHYFEDLSSAEIGTVLRVPAATIRFRLVIARRRLRPMLDDASVSASQESREVRPHAV